MSGGGETDEDAALVEIATGAASGRFALFRYPLLLPAAGGRAHVHFAVDRRARRVAMCGVSGTSRPRFLPYDKETHKVAPQFAAAAALHDVGIPPERRAAFAAAIEKYNNDDKDLHNKRESPDDFIESDLRYAAIDETRKFLDLLDATLKSMSSSTKNHG